MDDGTYANDLILCGASEEDLKVMVGRFAEVCRRGLKIKAGESKVVVLNGEGGSEREVHVEGFFRACLRI